MRPLELTVRNFRSYHGEPSTFDFRGRSLVGIVGPIGSGKSSLLDAVSFALYGKTPSGGSQTKALIHQRAADGGTMLRFQVDGEVWEVVRSLRRKGQSQHALYRYAADEPDTEPVERITQEGDVNDRIVELLGLDYDAFGRSVLLAQGRFAEFLAARPAQRDAVLKGVFGHDRLSTMREIAKERAGEVAAELGKVQVRTEQLDRVADRLDETRARRATVTARIELLESAEPEIIALEQRIVEATTAHSTATETLFELERHAGRLPDVEATRKVAAEVGAASDRRQNLAAALEAAELVSADAEAALAERTASGEQELIDRASALIATADPQRRAVAEAEVRATKLTERREELEAELVKLRLAVTDAAAAMERATIAAQKADTLLADAEEALHAARHTDMAAALRRTVDVGDTCPVCAQSISDALPDAQAVDVDAADAALTTARGARRFAEQQRSDAVTGYTRSTDAVTTAERQMEGLDLEMRQAEKSLETVTAELGSTRSALLELLGEGDPSELVAARRRTLTELTEAVSAGRRGADQARVRHDEAIRDEQTVAKRLTTVRLELTELAARLDRPIVIGGDDPAAIVEAATTLHTVWTEVTVAQTQALEAAETDRTGAMTEFGERLAELDVKEDLAGALATERARWEHLEGEIERDAKELASASQLLAERDVLEERHGRYMRISSDLTDARFVRYLLDEERIRLGEIGSEHFQRLSGGRYRFSDDGTFSIVDLTAADSVRKASSLSGGETFLASLALALSLAEMVTRTGGRLDAFFLDEGFGSLDVEHLDLAMDGIEALVSGDAERLVVVVSHVPEMRLRIEDVIELDKDPLTGDTKVVSA